MKYYVLMDSTGVRSHTLTLKALLYETSVCFSEQEVDAIASLMVGDTFKLEDVHLKYLAVRRVQS